MTMQHRPASNHLPPLVILRMSGVSQPAPSLQTAAKKHIRLVESHKHLFILFGPNRSWAQGWLWYRTGSCQLATGVSQTETVLAENTSRPCRAEAPNSPRPISSPEGAGRYF